jgi:methylated-DNA-[protein]-cysteine S-methyltransferase
LDGTDFQKRVWSELQKIPVGKVVTYGDLAKKLKTSPRAVGNACRANPILIIIPCHRVVGKNSLGGFSGQRAGKWLQIKEQLLKYEKYLNC